MDAVSLEFLRDQTLAARRALSDGLQLHQVALPSNWAIHDVEREAALRRRFRGTFTTNRLESWLIYVAATLKANPSLTPQAFINADNMSAAAIFNLGDANTPGHGDWRAEFKADATAAYAALIRASADRVVLDQQALVDFFADWSPNLVFSDSAMTPAIAIAAVRKVQVSAERKVDSEVQNLASSGSVMDAVAAKSTAGELPATFGFRAVPYDGFSERLFTVQLRLSPGATVPKFYLRLDQASAVSEDLEQEFRLLLTSKLPETLPVYLGGFTVAK